MFLKKEEQPPEILGDVNPDYVDSLLSEELRQLDFKTRDEIQEEELDAIPVKKAYNESQQHLDTYVNSKAFRMKILRADLFDEAAAAMRLVKRLEFMKEYYGSEVLRRPPRSSDLGNEELELLKSGGMQVLPCRDRSGRRMVICMGGHGHEYKVFTRIKVDYFFAWYLSEDESDQKDGIVFLVWGMPETIEVLGDAQDRRESAKLCEAAPIRTAGVHICLPRDPVFRFLSSLMLITLGREARKTTRIYTGTPTELLYSLMTFGIPAEQLPVTNTGTIKTKHHAQWMRLVQAKEKAERNGEAFDCIECPEINDVVFTLGRQTWCHPGYAMFRGLLETNFPRHNAADTMKAKRDITWEVVEEVEKKGGDT